MSSINNFQSINQYKSARTHKEEPLICEIAQTGVLHSTVSHVCIHSQTGARDVSAAVIGQEPWMSDRSCPMINALTKPDWKAGATCKQPVFRLVYWYSLVLALNRCEESHSFVAALKLTVSFRHVTHHIGPKANRV